MAEELIILPALVLGLAIGLLELFFIHADENFKGSHWMGHGIQAAGWAIAAVFATMNVEYVLVLLNLGSAPIISNPLYLQIVIGLITVIKTWSVSAVVGGAKGKGMHEKLWHILVIGALVVAAPYIYSAIEPLFPAFLK